MATDGIRQFCELRGDSIIEFEMLLFLLERELLLKRVGSERAADWYLSLLIQCLQRHAEEKGFPPSDPHWDTLMMYIAEHYDTVTLEEASKLMGFSTGYFCRLFKQVFSVTFHQFLDNVRFQAAKELMEYTNLTISEISEKTGFSHVTRFYREFKRIEGMTPHQYRNRFQNKGSALISPHLNILKDGTLKDCMSECG